MYKNGIFIIGFTFISFFVVLFYFYYINITIQLKSAFLSPLQYQSKLSTSVFILIFFTITTLIYTNIINRKIKIDKKRKKESRTELELINTMYKNIQKHKGTKQICEYILEYLSINLKMNKGVIYIANYKNVQLQLAATYNEKANNVHKIIDMYRGLMGQAIGSKSIQYKNASEQIIAIPLINNNLVIGVIELQNIKEEIIINDTYKAIVEIISNVIAKELEHDENVKYFNLINRNVILSSTNSNGDITYVSDAFCKNTGYTKYELIGESHRIFRDPNIKNEVYKEMWDTISSGKTWRYELPNIKKNGSVYWANTTIFPEYDFYNNIIGYTAIRQDITDKKTIEKISITDGLTNLYNRRYFDQVFPERLNLAKRLNEKLVFCMMDIDHFKQYNDTYGHQAGDITLQKVAESLTNSLQRESDFVFRLGGEEFGLLYFVKNQTDALELATKAKEDIENLQIIHEKNSASKYITVSMGLFIYENEDKTMKEIYKETDELLYKAKQNGRNQIYTHTKD